MFIFLIHAVKGQECHCYDDQHIDGLYPRSICQECLVILAIEAQYPSPNTVILHIHTSQTQFIYFPALDFQITIGQG
jgi:hypothetical protein